MTVPPDDPTRARETLWFDLSNVDLSNDDAIDAWAEALADHLRAIGFGSAEDWDDDDTTTDGTDHEETT